MENYRGRRIEGNFWRPEEPLVPFKGVLQLSDRLDGVLTLSARASDFDTMIELGLARKQWSLFGVLSTDHHVSLFNVGMMSGPATGLGQRLDVSNMELFTSEILIGQHVESIDSNFIGLSWLYLGGLKLWCDDTGFFTSPKNPIPELSGDVVSVSFQSSRTEDIKLNDNTSLTITSGSRGFPYFGNQKTVSLREVNSLELRFHDPISIRNLMRESEIWSNFLTFSTRVPSVIDEIHISIPGSPSGTRRSILILPTEREPSEPRGRDARSFLTTKSRLGDRFGHVLKSWRAVYDKIEIPILIFAGSAYQERAYLYTNVLIYLQVLEILHRELYDRCRFPDKKLWTNTLRALKKVVSSYIDDPLRGEISGQLNFIGAISLVDRLRDLYDRYPSVVGPLFRARDADMVLLKDARNFLTHYGTKKGGFTSDFLRSRQLYVLAERARLFAEICFLGASGLSEIEIAKLFENFDPYNTACWEAHREGPLSKS